MKKAIIIFVLLLTHNSFAMRRVPRPQYQCNRAQGQKRADSTPTRPDIPRLDVRDSSRLYSNPVGVYNLNRPTQTFKFPSGIRLDIEERSVRLYKNEKDPGKEILNGRLILFPVASMHSLEVEEGTFPYVIQPDRKNIEVLVLATPSQIVAVSSERGWYGDISPIVSKLIDSSDLRDYFYNSSFSGTSFRYDPYILSKRAYVNWVDEVLTKRDYGSLMSIGSYLRRTIKDHEDSIALVLTKELTKKSQKTLEIEIDASGVVKVIENEYRDENGRTLKKAYEDAVAPVDDDSSVMPCTIQ